MVSGETELFENKLDFKMDCFDFFSGMGAGGYFETTESEAQKYPGGFALLSQRQKKCFDYGSDSYGAGQGNCVI